MARKFTLGLHLNDVFTAPLACTPLARNMAPHAATAGTTAGRARKSLAGKGDSDINTWVIGEDRSETIRVGQRFLRRTRFREEGCHGLLRHPRNQVSIAEWRGLNSFYYSSSEIFFV